MTVHPDLPGALGETHVWEYAVYLKALVGGALVTDELDTSQMETQADSDIEALALAMVLYSLVNKVLADVKLDLRQLSESKKKLGLLEGCLMNGVYNAGRKNLE